MKIPKWIHPNNQRCTLGGLSWSVPRLFELSKDLPVMDIPIDHLNVFYTYKNLTLRDMVMHINAVHNADLDRPIILDEDGELMDGRHRLMRAMYLGLKTVKAVRFEENPSPCKVEDEQ